MRVAAIYDIHANLPALEAVLDDIRLADVDQVVVGGDVLPGPMPRDALARLRALDVPTRFILGNGERAVLAHLAETEIGGLPEQARQAIGWTAEQLSHEDARWIASWPATARAAIGDLGDVLFCHATPRDDNEMFTRLTAEDRLLPVFGGLDVALVVCGHTHMQFDRMVGRTRVVNAGSVGMPFGKPGADWLLLGPGVELRHTPYDLDKGAARVRATAYPQREEFAARYVVNPPTEEEMLPRFAAVELKA